MDILESIVRHLTSDEARRFKILSNRFKAEEEKKLLTLFDALRAAPQADKSLIEKIYDTDDDQTRNRYYRLRNKLLANLEKSLLFYHFNYRNALEPFSNVQIALLMRERGLYKETLYYLRKAEKSAVRDDHFSVLEVVYDEMVRLGTVFEVDVSKVLEARRENHLKLEIWRADQEVLALVTQELMRRNFARNEHTGTVLKTLEDLRERLEQHAHIFRSASGSIMILKTVVSILLQKEAWIDLLQYVDKTFADFEAKDLFNRENHGIRLMMRIWRINALLKILNVDDAGTELKALEEDLEKHKRIHYREFAFFYYSSVTYWRKLTGQLDEALTHINRAVADPDFRQPEIHYWFLLLAQADTYFCAGNIAEANNSLTRAIDHPVMLQVDAELQATAFIFKAICLKEMGDSVQSLEYLKRAKRDFRDQWKQFAETTTAFSELMIRILQGASPSAIRKEVQQYLASYPHTPIGGNQIILYEAYLAVLTEPDTHYYQAFQQELASRKEV